MTKEKAMKHLKNRRESLKYWQDVYVEIESDTRITANVVMYDGKTIKDHKREEILENIHELREEIAIFEKESFYNFREGE